MNLKVSGVVLYTGPSRINGKPIVVIATGLLDNSRNPNRKTGDVIQIQILSDESNPYDAAVKGLDRSVCGDCKHRFKDGKTGSCYVNLLFGPNAVYKAYKENKYPAFDESLHLKLFEGRVIRLGTYGDPIAMPLSIIKKICGVATGHMGYTHQWAKLKNFAYRKYCMASVDTLKERKDAAKRGWRTFRVRLEGEKIAKGEFVCPASEEAGKRLTCEQCLACSGVKTSPKAVSPVIIVHGLQWKQDAFASTIKELK